MCWKFIWPKCLWAGDSVDLKLLLRPLVFVQSLILLAVTGGLEAQQARILYYSSMPEIIRDQGRPGLARLATAVRLERAQSDNVIFVHGGASLGPSMLGALDRGAHMIDILNMIEPDLMAVGKREFSYQKAQFTLHALSASFPFVSSNLVQKSNNEPMEAVEPDYILELDGISVGFIALTSDNIFVQYGVRDIRVLPTLDVVQQKAASLRERGADAIILLADNDYISLTTSLPAGLVDATIYAHSLGDLASVEFDKVVLTEGALDDKLIVVTLDIVPETDDKPRSVVAKAETIDLHAYERDPDILALILSYTDRLALLLKQKIGVSTTSFDTRQMNIRTKENAFGNIVADAIREAMQADIAFLNSGGVRGQKSYKAGQTITREDIQRELPFNNTVELFEITGNQLLRALEWSLQCLDLIRGCFLQVSNIAMTYDLSRPVGSRVQSVMVNGKPLIPTQTYRLGTLNFLADGGDGFDMLKNSRRLTQAGSGKLMWEVVASYLMAQDTIAPKIEGRLRSITSNSGAQD